MTTSVAEAAKSLKTIGNDITVWENRLAVAKSDLEKISKTRDALQSEIDRKTSDFNIYIAQRDSEAKKQLASSLVEREQLEKSKTEFQEILKMHQLDKTNSEEQKKAFEIQKLKHASTVQNVQEYITAVRRATGLLGF